MTEWGSLADETPSGERRQQAAPPPPAAEDEWGSLDAAGPDGPGGPDGWGGLAEEPPGPAGPGGRRSGPFAPSAGVPVPSPEVVGSLLTAGETLWAQVDGTDAVLGSGCPATAVYDDEPDGFSGWRPVVVVDPSRLTVRPVPLSLAEPPVGAATSVAELYTDTEPPDTGGPRRTARFPVGQGPDLDVLLERAVAEERERVRTEAAAAARRAQEELAYAHRELAERTELVERGARLREERAEEAVRRARQEADRRLAEAESRADQRIAAAEAAARREVDDARNQVAQAVQQWQFRAQQAEAERRGAAEELQRANRTSTQRLVFLGVLAVIAVVLTVFLKGA
ncbi:hypothetical protein ABZ915_37680 [Streptomyces sp. NPDC046915]|uniref:hypothetical protein n=1 Tax=Streptomyces sp. NPDC046915 TaxID=3155257 RepID=UPI0033E4333E